MARNTVSVRIALEGGDTVKAQLKTLGKAFEQVGKSADGIAIAFQRFGAASSAFNFAITRSIIQVRNLALTAAGAVVGVGALANSAANSAKDIKALADSLGLTTDRVQQLQSAFAQQGVGPEQLTQGLTGVQAAFRSIREEFATPLPGQPKAIEEFKSLGITVTRAGLALKTVGFDEFGRKLADGVKPAIQKFDEFGVTVRRFGNAYKQTAEAVTSNPLAKLSGLTGLDLTAGLGEDPEKQLFRVFNALAKVQDQAERVNIAKALGIGPELLAVIKSGTAGIQQFADRLKATFDPEVIAQEQKLSAAFVNLRFVATQTKNAIGAVFAEGGQGASALESFTKLIEDNRDGLVQFARDVRDVVLPAAQDLILILSGKSNQVSQDSIFAGLVVDVPAAGRIIKETITGIVVPAFNVLLKAATFASNALKDIFNVDISPKALLLAGALIQVLGVFRLFGTAVGIVRTSILLVSSLFTGFFGILRGGVGIISSAFLVPFRAVTAVFGNFAGALALAATRVVGLFALGDLLISNWKKVKEFFGGLFTGIGDIWKGEFAKGFETLKTTALKAFEDLKNASTRTLLEIAFAATAVFSGVPAAIARVLVAGFAGLGNLLIGIVGGAFIEARATAVAASAVLGSASGISFAAAFRAAVSGIGTAFGVAAAASLAGVRAGLVGLVAAFAALPGAILTAAAAYGRFAAALFSGIAAIPGAFVAATVAVRGFAVAVATGALAAIRALPAAFASATAAVASFTTAALASLIASLRALPAAVLASVISLRAFTAALVTNALASLTVGIGTATVGVGAFTTSVIAAAVATRAFFISAAIGAAGFVAELLAVIGAPGLILAAIATAVTLTIVHWDELKQLAKDAFDYIGSLKPGGGLDQLIFGADGAAKIASGFAAIQAVASAFVTSLGIIFGDIGSALLSGITSAITAISALFDGLLDKARAVATAIASALSNPGNVPATGNPAGDVGGFASGGHIRGRGTGTSDSILARLSNGEYVIRAAMVRKLGVSFFDALNAGRRPSKLMSGFSLPKFATGGLVSFDMPRMMPAPIPAFAGGGVVESQASLHPVTFNIPGGGAVRARMTPAEFEDAQRSFLVRKSMRQA